MDQQDFTDDTIRYFLSISDKLSGDTFNCKKCALNKKGKSCITERSTESKKQCQILQKFNSIGLNVTPELSPNILGFSHNKKSKLHITKADSSKSKIDIVVQDKSNYYPIEIKVFDDKKILK